MVEGYHLKGCEPLVTNEPYVVTAIMSSGFAEVVLTVRDGSVDVKNGGCH